MGKLMYSCEQASMLSSRAMDEPLAPLERIQLRFHLMMCTGCTSFSHQIAFLRRASQKVPEALETDEDSRADEPRSRG
ncbi:MAG: zf-HC2 domain-containing protein [Betaproteobacteria bacterium]|nr:zf-HC2 domain-containing protein [Betaproteobacteria bacterium]